MLLSREGVYTTAGRPQVLFIQPETLNEAVERASPGHEVQP